MDVKDRIPAHPPTPHGMTRTEPQRHILMSPLMVGIGSLLAFFSVVLMVVVLPTATYVVQPSDNWLPLSNEAFRGRGVYLANGCVYCHSGYTRPQDEFQASYYLYPRISDPGDYYGVSQSPNILGTERTGPDLSQEAGNHPDMWHTAHYMNARSVNPLSIMPRFNFLSDTQTKELIAFNQSSGGKEGTLRYATLTVALKLMMISAGNVEDPSTSFPDLVNQEKNDGTFLADGTPDDKSPSGLPWGDVFDLNTFERSYWLTQDPLPVTEQNINRGRAVFEQRCSGCHGVKGLGDGPAAKMLMPGPDDFSGKDMFSSPTDSDGERYHRILTGGRGTAMENFGTRLSVNDVWRLVLFLRTIPNGGFEQPVTTVDRYQAWQAPPELLNYIKDHPITDPGLNPQVMKDPFMAAAHWIFGGLAPGDTLVVGGKMPVTLDTVAGLVKSEYANMVTTAYNDALGRGETLPSLPQLLDVSEVTWHDP